MPDAGETTPNIPVAAARAAAQLGRTVGVALEPSDLNAAGYRLLAYLVTGETASKVLAAKLAVSRPTVTATLDWLEQRGYAVRRPDDIDRRRVEIAITSKGLEALEVADRLVVLRLEEIMGVFDSRRAAEILAALEDLGTALNAYRARGIDAESGTIAVRNPAS